MLVDGKYYSGIFVVRFPKVTQFFKCNIICTKFEFCHTLDFHVKYNYIENEVLKNFM